MFHGFILFIHWPPLHLFVNSTAGGIKSQNSTASFWQSNSVRECTMLHCSCSYCRFSLFVCIVFASKMLFSQANLVTEQSSYNLYSNNAPMHEVYKSFKCIDLPWTNKQSSVKEIRVIMESLINLDQIILLLRYKTAAPGVNEYECITIIIFIYSYQSKTSS